MKFSEKISRKNPPMKAEAMPDRSSRGVKQLIRITATKTRFRAQLKNSSRKILKWIKKLA